MELLAQTGPAQSQGQGCPCRRDRPKALGGHVSWSPRPHNQPPLCPHHGHPGEGCPGPQAPPKSKPEQARWPWDGSSLSLSGLQSQLPAKIELPCSAPCRPRGLCFVL
jgi:hypothetical protein